MTFGNLVLRLRRRLQDIRTSSGTLIEDITTAGIRWSSEELIEITNGSLIELVRTANVYANSPVLQQLVGSGYFEVRGTIAFSSVSEMDAPSTVLAVTSLVEQSGDSRTFAYLRPHVFYNVITGDSAPRDEGFFYTLMYDVSASKRKLILGASYNGTLKYSAIYNKADFGTGDVSTELYIQGMDDILLDIAEREARDREFNWERSGRLDARIMFKMGFSQGGKQ